MDAARLLGHRSEEILADTLDAIRHAHLRHYEARGAQNTLDWLRTFYGLVLDSLRTRNASDLVHYVEAMARERHSAGFDLFEVQSAINMLEEAMWERVFKELEPADYAQALGMIGSLLGMCKDALARAYVSEASKTRAPSLNLRALFKGTDGG